MNQKQLYRFVIRGILLLELVFAPSRAITAQSIKRPYIGKHYFTPVSRSNLPAINTHLNTIISVGQTLDLVHQLEILKGSKIIGLQGEVSFVEMGFSYQQRVRDWLAAYVSLNVSARLGTELQSILTQGLNTLNVFNIGWHIRLLENDNIALSTNIELQNLRGSFINVYGFVQDIINDVPNPSIVENIPLLEFSTGLRFAYGMNELIGFRASADLAYGETYNRGENGFALSAAGGLDLDFYPKYSVPVGIIISYNITSMPEIVYIKNKYSKITRIKIAYTKSSDFSLGVEFHIMKIPISNQEKPPSAYSIALTSRYYF